MQEDDQTQQLPAEEQGSAFVAWPEINKFSTMLAEAKGLSEIADAADAEETRQILQRPTGIAYRGKIKLHGTNAGVSFTDEGVFAQSRTRVLIGCDNEGFAKWVEEQASYFKVHVAALRQKLSAHTFVVYGEWCGRGIMKGAAICRLSERYFCVFAVRVDDELVIDPTAIEDLIIRFNLLDQPQREEAIKTIPQNLRVLGWQTEEFVLTFSDMTELERRVAEMNELIQAIDTEDPWVKRNFNISGPGEGLVWYPVGLGTEGGRLPAKHYARFVFKAKGEKHLVVKQAKPIQTRVQVPQGVPEFVEMFVTEGRLEQGVNAACQDKFDKRFVGKFVQWVQNDVEKESKPELTRSGLKWTDVKAAVITKAREWYLAQTNQKLDA
jgi:hypothetical protein